MHKEKKVKRSRKVTAGDHEMLNANSSQDVGSTTATNNNNSAAATENRRPVNGTANGGGSGNQTRATSGMKLNATVVPTPSLPPQAASSGMAQYEHLENQEELLCEGFVFLPVDATRAQTRRFLSEQAQSNSSANNYTASYMTGKLLP